jgi:hypothetical protein
VSKILLSTLNSTYQHASFGLRYLYANLQEFQTQTEICEFTIAQNPRDIVEKILNRKPEIVGFGVYIWNTRQTLEVVQILKKVAPEITIILGGPEVSYETEKQELYQLADYVIKGEAEFLFYEFCKNWKLGIKPSQKLIAGALPEITKIQFPYSLYTENDLQTRTLYVEASRGCPYKCEYCLSSLDVSVRNFPVKEFLGEMQKLIDKGARTFKFVDRTFNLSPKISTEIMQFFLSHIDKTLFLHFEMVPDRLPDELKVLIEKFPAGSLQFEIGIQTWNPQVAANISRRQNYPKIQENLKYLKEKTTVHSHADLIVGLPGETVESFGIGFNALAALAPDEIQVGMLKRLKGTPIIRHDKAFEMVYGDQPPFQILQTKDISYSEMQVMARFAKYWDLVANSGNFKTTVNYLRTRESLFETFMSLSSFMHKRHPDSFGISLLNLTESLWIFLKDELHLNENEAKDLIIQDYTVLGQRDLPKFLRDNSAPDSKSKKKATLHSRQDRHLLN